MIAERSMSKANDFERALLEAVDAGLLALGESVRSAIYYYLEGNNGVRRQQIPFQLEAFHEALKGLANSGAGFIEMMIAKNLFEKLGLEFKRKEDWLLVDYVHHAKRMKEDDLVQLPLCRSRVHPL